MTNIKIRYNRITLVDHKLIQSLCDKRISFLSIDSIEASLNLIYAEIFRLIEDEFLPSDYILHIFNTIELDLNSIFMYSVPYDNLYIRIHEMILKNMERIMRFCIGVEEYETAHNMKCLAYLL